MMMDLQSAAAAMNAQLLAPTTATTLSFSAVSTDSRALLPGTLFFALRGANFDGHEFIAMAAAQGCVAAVVDLPPHSPLLQGLSLPLLHVANARLALGALAAHWRARFSIPVIGVTGSNGKTTTKEMIASIMRAAFGDAVLVTPGNLNNDIGMPLTLLSLNAQHRAAVIEMGMNQIGEMAYLANIVRPTVALVTNAQRAHLEGMGTLEVIAREKGSLYSVLSSSSDGVSDNTSDSASANPEQRTAQTAVAVINADDTWAPLWRKQCQHDAGVRILTFGFAQTVQDGLQRGLDVTGSCQIHGLDNRLSLRMRRDSASAALGAAVAPERAAAGGVTASTEVDAAGEKAWQSAEVDLALPGRHNALNALAAAATALATGIALDVVAQGLRAFKGVKGRLQRRSGLHGAVLLDDTYNANPDSVRAGIDVLAATVGRKILVLGDMGEIGQMTAQFHDEMGGYAKSQGIDRLFAVGEASQVAARNFGPGGQHYKNMESLGEALRAELAPDTTVLIKGSRFMRMERLLPAIEVSEASASKAQSPASGSATQPGAATCS
ncbi:MAG: UDP-N-acetylmuramoyl-tripeptide--D-alanyl-D-alanine ligase [Pseudomonadota bacterium]